MGFVNDVIRLDLTVRLIRKELPKNKDSEAGLHIAKYYVQYVSTEGYVLSTHLASENEKEALLRISQLKDGDIPESLLLDNTTSSE